MLSKNPLNDTEFLNELFSINEREIYVRITALTFNEQPLETIEGKATDGSINIDGASAVRRTCNLTMVAKDVNINEFYWGLKNKFKLEVGLKNNINIYYPDIIWFKQGIFVITQFNTTQTTNKWTIKIQGKDKMCLLNGDVSGHLPFNVDFGHEEYHNLATGATTYKEIPIKQIIYKAIQEFGRESAHNIIIKDIDEAGQELLEYRGLTPLYMFKDVESGEFRQISIKSDLKCYYPLKTELTPEEYALIPEDYNILFNIYDYSAQGIYILNDIKAIQNNVNTEWFEGKVSDEFSIIYDDLLDDIEFEGNKEATLIRFNFNEKYENKRYTVARIETGGIPGYRLTDLTYGGELKATVGESLTSVLDKIKNKFTNFEYFYDIDGKFVFQKKSDYLTTAWNAEDEYNRLLYSSNINSNILFNFVDGKLISSFQNTPKLTNLKNDYSVWGTRDKTTLHMRFAIDNKPTSYLPIRPLAEKIIQLHRDADGSKKTEKITTKYYDAPEVEPYNTAGLQSNDASYQLLQILDTMPRTNLPVKTYESIDMILSEWLSEQAAAKWLRLFTQSETSVYWYNFNGTNEDIKNMFIELNSAVSIYDTTPPMSIVPSDDGGEVWIVSYSSFARYPYGVEDVFDDNNQLIHHKVDWRELIYQMALDYRKLNYTDNFLYYLSEANPDFVGGKTGYEQYYIDLEGFWRQLYDPNPQVLFGEQISYQDIKKESLLLDNNATNDILDRFYITNSYRSIEDEDIDTLTYDQVYCYGRPKSSDGKTTKVSFYAFPGSHKGALLKNMTYYTETTDALGNKVMESASWNGNFDSDSLGPYEKLNSIQMDKIYVKNDEAFETRIPQYNYPNLFQKNVFYVVENNTFVPATEYDPKKSYYKRNYDNTDFIPVILKGTLEGNYLKGQYYIKINNNYILSKDEFDEDVIYYEISWPISVSYENKFETGEDNTEFRTLIYPSVSGLDTYADREVSDYILYIQQQFDALKEEMANGSEYYLKDSGYIKLSECQQDNNLWNLYYMSDLYPLSYYTTDSLANLEIINSNKLADMYKSNYLAYVEQILSTLSQYTVKLNNKDFITIQTVFLEQLTKLFDDYKIKVINLLDEKLESLKTNFNDNADTARAMSCLYYQLAYYKDQINKIQAKNFGTLMEQQLEKITLMKNINLNLSNFINNINSNYQQVVSVTQEKATIESATTINEIKTKVNDLIKNLSAVKEHYYEGQLQKTLNQLETLRDSITDNGNIDTYKANFNKIVLIIEDLNNFINEIKTVIFDKIFIVNEDDSFCAYESILQFLSQVSQLSTLLDGTVNFDIINEILFFEGESLIPELADVINATDINAARQIIANYNQSSKNFQEYIIKHNINHFNYLKNDTLIYEPIQYYRASYAYNHDQQEGNYWLLDIYDNPQLLTFWFDFLEPYSTELMKYAVPSIGSRIKVVNDKDVKAMHYKDIPNIIFKNSTQTQYDTLAGYTYANVTDAFMNLFGVSSKGKTAKERIDELLYNHSYCSENINISVIPVYTLEPNNKIYIRDDKCQINGKYLINKITIPLNYQKLMSITALKDVDDII